MVWPAASVTMARFHGCEAPATQPRRIVRARLLSVFTFVT